MVAAGRDRRNLPPRTLQFTLKPMAERMTLEEIERAYANEWVVVADYTADDSVMVRDGVVLAHSPTKATVLEATAGHQGDLALWFVGKPAAVELVGFVGVFK
jgi:hypothetical protein